MKTAIYLRKSRADEEKEKFLGQGETLSIHRKELLSVARIKSLDIVKIYEELVSGESLLRRPAMLELLNEVEDGKYEAVLVMDLQRLGRGDMEEQGIILKAFKKSHTIIITPDKTYDLSNEFDEEYSEFEAFMSRKEYKMINKRLQRGVLHSVKEGNYNGTYAPFGYDIVNEKTYRTLKPNPQQSEIIKMIFNWYANENVGGQIISDRLNSMGITTNKGNKWSSQAVAFIIKNPLYIGKITWHKTFGYISSKKCKGTKSRPQEEWLIVNGKHDPIIDEDTYNRANAFLKTHAKSPVKPKTTLNNSLAGLVICGVCGMKMRYRPYLKSEPHLMCINKCGNKSSKYKYVEKDVINKLHDLLAVYTAESTQDISNDDFNHISALNDNLVTLEKEMAETLKQKDNLHNLLERGIYTPEVFIERSKALTSRMDSVEQAIITTRAHIDNELKKHNKKKNVIPQIAKVIDVFETSKSPDEKNLALKEILESITYTKTRKQRNDDFEICLNTRF